MSIKMCLVLALLIGAGASGEPRMHGSLQQSLTLPQLPRTPEFPRLWDSDIPPERSKEHPSGGTGRLPARGLPLGIRNLSLVMRDVVLVDAVRRAAAQPNVTPENVGKLVGINPTFNSKGRRRLWSLSLGFNDVDRETELALLHRRKVIVTWNRAIPSNWPPVVGMCWLDDGSIKVFTGVITGP
jgi:hypothetical protein